MYDKYFYYMKDKNGKIRQLKIDIDPIIGKSTKKKYSLVDLYDSKKYRWIVNSFMESKLYVYEVSLRDSNDEYIRDYFTKINTQKVRLNTIEVLFAAYYNDYYMDLLEKISKNLGLDKNLGKGRSKRMKDYELIVMFDGYRFGEYDFEKQRFIYDYSWKREGKISFDYPSEDDFIEAIIRNRKEFYTRVSSDEINKHMKELEKEFEKAINTYRKLFQVDKLKNPVTGKTISRPFIRLLVLLSLYSTRIKSGAKVDFRQRIEDIISSEKNFVSIENRKGKIEKIPYKDLFSDKTHNKSRVIASMNLLLNAFEEILGPYDDAPYTKEEYIKYRKEITEKIRRGEPVVCHICGKPIEDVDDLHIDHVIPVSRGGTSGRDNLKPAHVWCNIRKSNKKIQ